MVARWAKVKDPDGAVWTAVSFPYHPAMVAAIKEVPSRQRRWIPDLKVWLVDPPRWEVIVEREAEAGWTFTRDPALGRAVVEWWVVHPEESLHFRGPGETKKQFDSRMNAEGAAKEGRARKAAGPSFYGFGDFAEAMRSGRVRFTPFPMDPDRSSSPPPPVRRGHGPTDADYRVLGVSPDDSPEAVKAAHRRLALELHPDRGGDEEKLKVVNVARDRIMAAIGVRP